MVSVESLRAYLQIVDVASILRLDRDIADHAFELFKECSTATCLRNRGVEALATAALVQDIREAQEPRTLKELAAHIGEVVVNKCFCTRPNSISISATAIYLACQLEDKRNTQAEICKVTGLTEVTLRKVYKELLENWDDLLSPNYTPATPLEKAFTTTTIYLARSSSGKDIYQDKLLDAIKQRSSEAAEPDHMVIVKEEEDNKVGPLGRPPAKLEQHDLNQASWQPNVHFSISPKLDRDKKETSIRGFNLNEASCTVDSEKADITLKPTFSNRWLTEPKVLPSPPNRQPVPWQFFLQSFVA